MGLLRAPWVLAIVGVAAVWYWRGSRRPRLRALDGARRRRARHWRGACFAAGLVTIVIALDSSVERLADDYFWAHMLQHVLLMLVAAPLLVLGAPWIPFWRPLPLAFRRRVARAILHSGSLGWLRLVAAFVATPWCAWVLFNADLGIWHVPGPYDLTLRNTAVHYAEHATFVLLGILFWSQLLESPPFHPRLGQFGRAIYATAGSAASWLLAVVLAIAPTPLYPAQEGVHPGGISGLADQQLAAGVMLGVGSIPYAIVVFYCLYAWLGEDEPRRRHRRVRHSSLGTEVR
jgi:putative membrane protein